MLLASPHLLSGGAVKEVLSQPQAVTIHGNKEIPLDIFFQTFKHYESDNFALTS